jgi:hypothetical protein
MFECRLICRAPLRLDKEGIAPLETEPMQVLENRLDELGPTSRPIQILDPEEEPAAVFVRQITPD